MYYVIMEVMFYTPKKNFGAVLVFKSSMEGTNCLSMSNQHIYSKMK